MLVRSVLFVLALALPIAADVVVLKDGGKVSGRVVDRTTHIEVTTEGGLRTFTKDEVERIITSPAEIVGDSDKLFAEAKKEFQDALAAGGDGRMRDIAAKVAKAREAYAAARELFPEDKYAELDGKLVQVMQLLRLVRERMGSQIAGNKTTDPLKTDSAATPAPVEDALKTLRDAAKRSDPARRRAAMEAFRANRVDDVAVASMLFLGRTDAEWKLAGPSLDAMQEYFGKPWVAEMGRLAPEKHLEAAKWIADRTTALRKADATASTEALSLFGAAHVGHAPAVDVEKTARAIGLTVDAGVAGSAEGQVAYDLARWIRAGDNDLAVLAWVKEFRAVDTPNVRYVWSIALLRLAHQRKRGFERALNGLESIKGGDAALRDHVAALLKSIKAVANCGVCAGDGRTRCTNCHGRKEIKVVCKACDGSGRMKKQNGFQLDNCPPCKSTGYEKSYRCTKCKDGYFDCSRCDGPRECPERVAICSTACCPSCDGRGSVFRRVRLCCPSCRGLGELIAPAADPAKILFRE